MYVRVLGPVAAGPRADEVEPVTGQISAAVLAQLVLADGRWLSADALIDAVWDDPPTSARNAIQVAVSKLRKQFGSGLVLSSSYGYSVDTSAVSTDWHEAFELVADARRQLELGDPRIGADQAAAAVALFRGEPLLGLVSRTADSMRRAALDLIGSAREVQTRALLALHLPEEAIATIQPICDADPLNEPARLLLIEAYAAAGRLAAALASYHQLRHALAEELGVDPSPAAQDLFTRLLHTGPPSSSAAPSSPGTSSNHEPGGPVRRQLTLGLAPSRATAYQTRPVRQELPATGTAVLVGPSGVGKTQVVAGAFADSEHPIRVCGPRRARRRRSSAHTPTQPTLSSESIPPGRRGIEPASSWPGSPPRPNLG